MTSCINMDDWGEITLIKIESGDDFWTLLDELMDDNSGFFFNRNHIVSAYKDGNLYGLQVEETDSMYERGTRSDTIFCRDYRGILSWYLLPCFCIMENNTALIIWTHTRARKNGFAKKLVELLKIKDVCDPLPDSLHFWRKCNIFVPLRSCPAYTGFFRMLSVGISNQKVRSKMLQAGLDPSILDLDPSKPLPAPHN